MKKVLVRYFKIDIENKSTDKILTSVTIVLTYKDNSREGDSFFRNNLYVLPGNEKRLSFSPSITRSEDTIDETINLEKPLTGKYTKKGNWDWKTLEAKYVNFVMK